MSDNKPYMTHDLGARNDPKLVAAERASRGLYKAIWWDLTEMIWENGGHLQMDFDNLAYILRYPKPEEVRAVVMDFDLFVNDGEQFWNNSALERIQHKKDVSTSRSDARRGASRNVSATNENQLFDNCPTNENQLSDNKLINKINKKNNLSARGRAREDEEREREIFEIFFFRNFADPVGELDRFRDFYYKDGSWKNSNGREISDIRRTAKEWRPENDAPRFKADFLQWYQGVYAEAKKRGAGISMLSGLEKVLSKGARRFALVFKDEKMACAVMSFVEELDLQGDLFLEFGGKPVKK